MTDKKPKKPKSKMGRPRIPMVTPDLGELESKLPKKEIDFNQVLYWMDLGSTQEEIAGSFYVSVDTLSRRLKEQTGHTFAELKEKCCGASKVHLRENQFKLTKTNATMAIWLGKMWLGQKEDDNALKEVQEFVNLVKIGAFDKIKDLVSQT